MKYPQNVLLCGMGGQGIILSAVILGTAAVTKNGKYAVQTQSYGSEARGGQCQAELIIDEQPIVSPVAGKKDVMVAMFQEAYDKYISTLDEEGLLIYDSALVGDLRQPVANACPVPATDIAVKLGNRMAANMVMLGFMCEYTGCVSNQALKDTVSSLVSEKFLELDLQAVDKGIEYARSLMQGAL